MSDADDDMDKPVTRRELREVMGEAFAHFLKLLDERFESFEKRFEKSFEVMRLENAAEHAATRAFVSSEIARHTAANAEQNRAELVVIDDKYKDLPDRVTKLEAAVFPAPPAKRQRRR